MTDLMGYRDDFDPLWRQPELNPDYGTASSADEAELDALYEAAWDELHSALAAERESKER